jgi:ring-1,2-phenylacetyl-CoA epoxidase subunit PaaE
LLNNIKLFALAHFHSTVIKKIQQETLNSVILTFDIPENLKAHFSFKAGQYLTLQAKVGKDLLKRSYSICSSPSSGLLQVGVKAISKGLFSNYLNDALREGDSIEISKPEGRFIFDKPDGSKKYCGFASGSGITPIMSIIQEVLVSNSKNVFVLAYGNKSKASTMFLEKIQQLKSDYKGRFFSYSIYSQETHSEDTFGRIDSNFIRFVLNQHPNFSFDKIYLCGPEEMIKSSSATLVDQGNDKDNIVFELFYSKPKAEVTESSGAQVKIHYDDEVFEVNVPEKMTILDAALQKNLDVPYSCQGGVCSTCIAKITSGSAKMIQNNILTDAEVEEGLVLACQAVPLSKNITIDFDDV